MKITRRTLQKIIKEELRRSLGEIRASGITAFGEFPPIPLSDPHGVRLPVSDDIASEGDPDDDSDDLAEIIDMLSDEFNADQLRALEFVLSRAKDRREKTSDYIGRMHHGDPYQAMHNLVTGE